MDLKFLIVQFVTSYTCIIRQIIFFRGVFQIARFLKMNEIKMAPKNSSGYSDT